MKSSKVSKVLATSRLSKRVRDKIRNSKQANINKPNPTGPKDTAENVFVSRHEDGSIEQYRELLDMASKKKS